MKKMSQRTAQRALQLRRKLRRSIGSAPDPKLIGVVVERGWVKLHYRKEYVMYQATDELMEDVAALGFIDAGNGIFVNRRATLADIALMGRPEITLAPV